MFISGKYDATPVAGSEGDIQIAVDEYGRVITSATSGPSTVSTATPAALASAATSAQLLAANASRKGLLVTNTDANTLYLKYGATASATDFTVAIPTGAYWEMPQPIYTGRIDVIWAADGSGSAVYTEL